MVINSKNMDLYTFIKNETGHSLDDSSLNLSIQKDLDIYGDEAYDFIIKFSSAFEVDIKGFEFNKYFHNEVDKFSLLIFSFFFRREKKDLTINDLKKAMINRKLT